MLRSLNLSRRLYLLIAMFTISFSIFGLWSFKTLHEIKVGGEVFHRIGESKDLVSDLLPPPLYIVESYLLCLQLDRAADSSPSPDLVQRLRYLETQYRQRHAHWEERLPELGLPSTMLDNLNIAAEAFFDEVWQHYLPSLESRHPEAQKRSLEKLNTLYEQHRLAVDLTIPAAEAHSAREEDWVAQRVTSETLWLLGVLLLSLLAAIGLAHLIRRSIAGPLAKAVEVAQRVAAGDWQPATECQGYRDEPGQLLTALYAMAATLQHQMEALGKSEARSRHARELLEKLIESADLIVVGVDPQGRITLFNEAAARASGYQRKEVLGQDWSAIQARLNPELRLDDLGSDQRNAAQARTYDITHLSGARRRIIWRFTEPLPQDAMHLEDGDVAEISFGIDVTEQLQAEKALRDAVAAAEAAHQSRDDFLAGMSHEIRTPMNVIIGMTGLALRTDLPERARHHLNRVVAASQSLMRLINDVLDYAKIESGKLTFENRPFVLCETLDALTSQTVLEADEKGLGLRVEIASEVPSVLVGDQARLGQVLLNLVGSALKFTEEGEIIIRVDCLDQNESQALLRFEVRDTSLGLTPEQIAGLFSALIQFDPAPARSPLGTGLGLAISRHLVESMHGRVWVESEPGQGTRFIFTCRLGVQAAANACFNPLPRMQDLRVLIVDDDPGSREVLASIVGAMHPQLTTVSDGAQALAELQHAQTQGQPYQLVLMDWQMSDMDGLETVRRMQKWADAGQALSVIMVTAHSRDDLLAQAHDVRLDAVLEKPISPRSVLDALQQALNHLQRTTVPAPLKSTAPTAAALRRPLAGLRVLLVEDNDLNQELAASLLTEAGAQVSVAADGQEALDQLHQAAFDLVLMDWKMPRMDGLEATRRLRAEPRFADLPIVAMTSSVLPSDKEACLQAGMNDHLSKPIDPVLLLSKVARWGRPSGPDRPPAIAGAGRSPLSQALRKLVGPLWAELETLLSEHDSHAASLAQPIAHLLHEHPNAHGFKGVTSLIEAGEFANALNELRRLGGQLQLQGP